MICTSQWHGFTVMHTDIYNYMCHLKMLTPMHTFAKILIIMFIPIYLTFLAMNDMY